MYTIPFHISKFQLALFLFTIEPLSPVHHTLVVNNKYVPRSEFYDDRVGGIPDQLCQLEVSIVEILCFFQCHVILALSGVIAVRELLEFSKMVQSANTKDHEHVILQTPLPEEF